MKLSLLALCSVLLAACAGMRVTHTEVATGAVNPPAIYIRPFSIEYAAYHDAFNPNGAVAKSLAPIAFANDLQEELSKIAPAKVLAPDECATLGWLVEGQFEVVDSGDFIKRGSPGGPFGLGRSCLVLHVRVTDLGKAGVEVSDAKEGVSVLKSARTSRGRVIYEFDVAGGSRGSGKLGSISAPGLGDAIPFDFRNAAERIMLALSPDPFRYGDRSSPVARY